MRDFGDDAEAIDSDDDFDSVDDFSDDDGVRRDGWREDEPDSIHVDQTSPYRPPHRSSRRGNRMTMMMG